MDFRILGPLEAVTDGRVVALDAAKPRALLAILLLHVGEPVSRDRLIEDLWEGRPPATAAKVLQTYVSQLRKALGSDVILTRPSGYELVVEPDGLDLHRFERLVADARGAEPTVASERLRAALALWRGPPLGEFAYERWAQAEIGRLEELRLSALLDRIEVDLALGRDTELVGELEQLVAARPLSEPLRGQLMLALYRSGRQAEALAAYRDARETLVETLGIEPGAALRQLERAILDQDPVLDVAVVAPVSAAPRRSLASPTRPTSFVGREEEVREISSLLRSVEVRLLTLTGAGGAGKTRLAIEAARSLGDELPDGVVLVELAPISGADLVSVVIADSLGIGSRTEQEPREALAAFLRDREMLLVLDSFEHVIEAAPLLADVLVTSRALKLLVTSRSPLDLSEERIFPVPALELPDPSQTARLQGLRRVESVRLFVERAQHVRPDFELTEANADAVAELCRQMDGLPLALELAAARIKLLSPAAILERLGQRLELLKAAPGTGVPERHRTLRAATEWSYDLLATEEQAVFTSLAVFAGAFTLDGAAAVAGEPGRDVVDSMESLLNDNLLRTEPMAAGEPRFGMLGTIREYALEQLAARGDADERCRRHAHFYAELAEEAEPALLGPRQRAWLERLDAELANVRAAIRWSVESGELETGLRVGAALWRFWQLRGLMAEARGDLEHLLEGQAGSEGARALARARVASLAHMQGDWEAAQTFGEAALPDLRRLKDDRTVATHIGILAISSLATGDLDRARALAEEGFELARRSGDAMTEAYARNTLGAVLAQAGQLDDATRLLAESVAMARRLGNVRSIAMWSRMLGNVALARGDREQARLCFEESLAVGQTLADPWATSRALSRLALMAADAGDEEQARRLAVKSIEIEKDAGSWIGQLLNLEVFAALAAAAGRPRRAARLYGCASVIRASAGSQDWPDRNPDLSDLRRALGEDAFAEAWEQGRGMTLDEALHYALEARPDAEPA